MTQINGLTSVSDRTQLQAAVGGGFFSKLKKAFLKAFRFGVKQAANNFVGNLIK
ncbi:MAG: hypothetical protein K2W96_15230 [Gemmataceae bacterium]|nr:hypothetical protein [Gemmataceae bacterium]